MPKTTLQELEYYEQRLTDLRKEWRFATPAYKKFIESSAPLLKSLIQSIKEKNKE